MANDFENSVVRKRPAMQVVEEGMVKEKKRRKKDKSQQQQQQHLMSEKKNPVSLLNELRMGLDYKFLEQSGPQHAPVFKVSVDVDGQTYYGVGGSKKKAKCRAAEEALKSFIQFPDNTDVLYPKPIDNSNVDFTSDDTFESTDDDNNKIIPIQVNINKKSNTTLRNHEKQILKGPAMLLNELFPNAVYEYTESDNCLQPRFKVSLTIGEGQYFGYGSNKRLAKNAAATAALSKLSLQLPDLPNGLNGLNDLERFRKPKIQIENQEKADHIRRLIHEKFAELMANDEGHAKRKVLAGIVMTRGNNLNDSEIVSVTTGTKCVSGEYISLNGYSLNDLHAEIISRRCLINYLYDQLYLLLTIDADKSIFTLRSDGCGYQLKDGLEFHLYINTAPCGDARVFGPHEECGVIDKHPNRKSRGQLRTKIESGEGTIPVKGPMIIQTWDGILLGERLLTMSCSDKICRWNIVGLQGALLSHFIEPIYFKSITLGSLLRESHLSRALFGRIETTLQGLPPPFRLNRPEMYLSTSPETRQIGKAPNFSVIWAKGFQTPEIVDANTSKLIDGSISKLCKNQLMKRFVGLLGKLSSITGVEQHPPVLYCEAKNSVTSYKIAKQSLYQAFSKAQLGNWVTKPLEQDMFELDLEEEEEEKETSVVVDIIE